jgi:tetratricopeptide (TPR) repeat protein
MAHARELFEANRFPEAQHAFEGLLATDPGSAEVRYYVGALALERGDTDTAVRELERSVELAPDIARWHLALGDAYGRSAEKAWMINAFRLARRCLAEYRRAVTLDPGSVDVHERLFEYYSRAPSILGGGSDKAAGEAATIERLDPRRARQAYAAVYLADGKYELALAELDQVLKSAPDDYASLFQVGHLAAISGQYPDRGLASLRHCLGLAPPPGAPSHSAAQWRMGNILERKGDAAGAREAYEAALKLDPTFTPASEALRSLNLAPTGR